MYNSNFYTNHGSAVGSSAVAAIIAIFCILLVIYVASLWRIFRKAGRPGWASVVPIYSSYTLLRVIGWSPWWLFMYALALIPFIGWAAVALLSIVIAVRLAEAFGRGELFGFFGLYLFSFIGYPILAFGSATYLPTALSTETSALDASPVVPPANLPTTSPPAVSPYILSPTQKVTKPNEDSAPALNDDLAKTTPAEK